MKPIRVPIPCELIVTNETLAVVLLHLVMGTCNVVFSGLEAVHQAQNYYDWVGNSDPSPEKTQ